MNVTLQYNSKLGNKSAWNIKKKICHWENSIYHKNTYDFKNFFKDQSYTDILKTQTSI